MTTHTTPAKVDALIQAEPDLVDRIFEYIFQDPALAQAFTQQAGEGKDAVEKLKEEVRGEFEGEMCYIAGRPASKRQETAAKVLSLFNGRNASEVARKLNIGRTTVYRILKQPRLYK
jgi:Mor family transcriptional regulator